jgi:hypothetical protein
VNWDPVLHTHAQHSTGAVWAYGSRETLTGIWREEGERDIKQWPKLLLAAVRRTAQQVNKSTQAVDTECLSDGDVPTVDE